MKSVKNARPHPGPLPQGEGEARSAAGKSAWRIGRRHLAVTLPYTCHALHDSRAERRQIVRPLPGERAGVRANVLSRLVSPAILCLALFSSATSTRAEIPAVAFDSANKLYEQ